MKVIIENQSYDQERALYGLDNADIKNCSFGGPADGESALKESNDIEVIDCDFKMRYVLWHVNDFSLIRVKMDEATRAALWYDDDGKIIDCVLHGPKALRECRDIELFRCDIASDEFGWKCDDISLNECTLSSVYPFLDSKDIELENVKINAKYSFQYVQGAEIRNCELMTKDAFWHAKDVTVEDTTIDSEYIGWYSENLTLVRCHIRGTQPFCYCKNLKLVDCVMEGCDRSFEYSSVHATIKGRVDSIKNPLSGKIEVDELGEMITEGSVKPCHCEVIVGGTKI